MTLTELQSLATAVAPKGITQISSYSVNIVSWVMVDPYGDKIVVRVSSDGAVSINTSKINNFMGDSRYLLWLGMLGGLTEELDKIS